MEEYWKQRCLLAESILDSDFKSDIILPIHMSPEYNEFMRLLNKHNLTYEYSFNKDKHCQHRIRVMHPNGGIITSTSTVEEKEMYNCALQELKKQILI